VHAASFIRSRRIVLESSLLRQRRIFRLILVHETFHFVWVRLGNEKRREFSRLLEQEFASDATGELGCSAQLKKDRHPTPGTRGWRDYACESFCDTAAFLFSGLKHYQPFTLPNRWIELRRAWFAASFKNGCRG
jgi:hypothetical protein